MKLSSVFPNQTSLRVVNPYGLLNVCLRINSFDITILLFGVCFNLAGLPYSAGFLGKEFLLFQVMRDDFISLFVRGC